MEYFIRNFVKGIRIHITDERLVEKDFKVESHIHRMNVFFEHSFKE